MQFEINKNIVNFEEFSGQVPICKSWERQLLDKYQELTLCLNVGIISLKYGSFNKIDINLKNMLDKHKRHFFKNSPYKDPLARALGLKAGQEKPTVLDATAGLMGDSSLIYSYGVKTLYLVERNPIVGLLIENALENYPLENIDFFSGDLRNMPFDKIEIGFFDPMYQQKNEKSSPKKQMIVFRDLVGADDDKEECAKFLLNKVTKRLVLKRSIKGRPLLEKPDFTVKGKSTAYDVYLK